MGPVISIEGKVSQSFPEVQVRFVVAYGLHNNEVWPDLEDRLTGLEKAISSGTWCPFNKEDRQIASWHAAYRNFGTNPNRIRPSVDALGRRLAKTGKLPRISPAVDAYNFVSVLFGAPAGAFDLSKLGEQIDIRPSREGDLFTPLGEPEVEERPNPGEIVYAEAQCVLTRHWNHRDSDKTKITEESKVVVFIIERVDKIATSDTRMSDAQQTLAELVRPHADHVVLSVIDPETPTAYLAEGDPGLAI